MISTALSNVMRSRRSAVVKIRRSVDFLRLALASVLVFSISVANAPSAHAEPEEEDAWAGVEVMVIVGTTAEGLLSTTGTSVTAFDATSIEALGVKDVGGLAQFTPNLEIKTAGATSATLFIRGIGLNDFTANGAGAVAVYQDDIALNLPAIQLGQIFDVSEVQVLKGPIGSGPGRNASAGAIKIYANKPTGDFGGKLRFDYGNFNSKDSEGFLEIPIMDDVLSSRFSFRFTERDGTMLNRCARLTEAERLSPSACGSDANQAIPAGLSKNLNDTHSWAVRGFLRFVPPSDDLDMSWLLGLHLGRIDQLGTVGQSFGANEGVLGLADAGRYVVPEIAAERALVASDFPPAPPPAQCRVNPNRPGCASRDAVNEIISGRLAQRPLDKFPFEGDFNRDGYERQSSWGGFVRGEWTVDPVTITSITGYEFYDRERLADADYGPNVLFEFDIEDKAWQATQEVRVGGELESAPVSWEVGGYALFEELDYRQLTLPGVNINIFKIDQDYTQETASFAFYGEFKWDLLDDLELEAGARYNWERKSIDADVVIQNNPLCLDNAVRPGPLVCQDTQTFDHPTGLVKLRYFLTEDVSISAKYTHGWKGPQYNVRDGSTQLGALDIAGPEKLDALEWGMSGDWFDGRLHLQGAIFFYDYQDYQVFTFSNELGTPPQRIVVNADDAQLYGAELEVRVEPVERLILDVRFGWLESKFLDFTRITRRQLRSAPNVPADVIQTPLDFNGNRLPNTPRFKVSLSAEYTVEMGRFGSLVPRYDLSWTDDIFFDQTEGRGSPGVSSNRFPDFTVGQKALALHNMRLTYIAPGDHMEIAGWIRNATNEVYKTTAFDASQGVRLVGNLLGLQRTYGLSVSLKY